MVVVVVVDVVVDDHVAVHVNVVVDVDVDVDVVVNATWTSHVVVVDPWTSHVDEERLPLLGERIPDVVDAGCLGCRLRRCSRRAASDRVERENLASRAAVDLHRLRFVSLARKNERRGLPFCHVERERRRS